MTQDKKQGLQIVATSLLPRLLAEKTLVILVFPEGLNGKSAPLSVEGEIVHADISIARFHIHEYSQSAVTIENEHAIPALMPCQFNFVTTLNKAGVDEVLLWFGGKANLLHVEYSPSGLPSHFLLKVGDDFAVRRARRHPRLDWQDNMHAVVGLDMVRALPKSRENLLQHLKTAFKETPARPQVVNLSMGGLCLNVPRLLVRQTQGLHDTYLFSYYSANPAKGKLPTVFLSRKLGVRQDISDYKSQAFRMQFLRELDWTQSGDTLVWKDISESGSESVNEFFDMVRTGIVQKKPE